VDTFAEREEGRWRDMETAHAAAKVAMLLKPSPNAIVCYAGEKLRG
jgi:hypothetical protein